MEYLLDTNTLIWALFDDKYLPDDIKDVLNNSKNHIFYANSSLWEIEIKHLKNPSRMPLSAKDVLNAALRTNIIEMDIRDEYIIGLEVVVKQNIHKDPFDHIVLSISKNEDMILITSDKLLEQYKDIKILSYRKCGSNN